MDAGRIVEQRQPRRVAGANGISTPGSGRTRAAAFPGWKTDQRRWRRARQPSTARPRPIKPQVVGSGTAAAWKSLMPTASPRCQCTTKLPAPPATASPLAVGHVGAGCPRPPAASMSTKLWPASATKPLMKLSWSVVSPRGRRAADVHGVIAATAGRPPSSTLNRAPLLKLALAHAEEARAFTRRQLSALHAPRLANPKWAARSFVHRRGRCRPARRSAPGCLRRS